MAIVFLIPAMLRDLADGKGEVGLEAGPANVESALAALWAMHPGLRDRVVNEQGALRQHVNVFVGEDNSKDHGGLSAPVKSGDTITIVPAVSGG